MILKSSIQSRSIKEGLLVNLRYEFDKVILVGSMWRGQIISSDLDLTNLDINLNYILNVIQPQNGYTLRSGGIKTYNNL